MMGLVVEGYMQASARVKLEESLRKLCGSCVQTSGVSLGTGSFICQATSPAYERVELT